MSRSSNPLFKFGILSLSFNENCVLPNLSCLLGQNFLCGIIVVSSDFGLIFPLCITTGNGGGGQRLSINGPLVKAVT